MKIMQAKIKNLGDPNKHDTVDITRYDNLGVYTQTGKSTYLYPWHVVLEVFMRDDAKAPVGKSIGEMSTKELEDLDRRWWHGGMLSS